MAHFATRAHTYGGPSTWVDDEVSMAPIGDTVAARRPDVILDLGSGSGAVRRFLASRGLLPSLYVGLDLSLGMLSTQDGRTARVAAHAAHLPVRDGAVDLVIARQTMHYFTQPGDVLAEAARVLTRRGGLTIAQIIPFDAVEDADWWQTAVRLRQPLRRHAWTSKQLQTAVRTASFTLDAATYVERRSSLMDWMGRYPIDDATGSRLITHFRKAPPQVRELRQLLVSDSDVEYSIRWLILSASLRDRGTADRDPA
ncbi:class I SAM-dependent methyltransferase [Streptomyces sp. NPDC001422]|uniref:class I SAM-dependent methyltransferase n=1 Tax=Streptomyces sp. NPDC001422 TaxID=3364575 RepID=UPI0036BAE638